VTKIEKHLAVKDKEANSYPHSIHIKQAMHQVAQIQVEWLGFKMRKPSLQKGFQFWL